MIESDKPAFAKLLSGLGEYYGKQLSSEAIGIYWAALEGIELHQLQSAARLHVMDHEHGNFMPKAADFIRHVDDGFIGADEAWAIALPAQDENNTVVWTQEICECFFQAAMPLLEVGDKVGARMAFRAAYERRSKTAPEWIVSLGRDVQGREDVIKHGIEIGRLESSKVQHLLSGPIQTSTALQVSA